jgi:4'-phosphopantetheinyl transferase
MTSTAAGTSWLKRGALPGDLPPDWGVEVWKASLGTVASGEDDSLAALLSDDERTRAAQFVFDQDRRRFVRSRAALRTVLGQRLGIAPSSLVFAYGPQGKPELDAHHAASREHFNLAHSGDWALVALARDRRVGVDVEQVRPGLAETNIAQRHFAAREVAALRNLPPEMQDEAFFRCWTRKEAYLKALGCGLSLALDAFTVSLAPGEPEILSSRDDPEVQKHWRLIELHPAAGYIGSVALEARPAPGDWQSAATRVKTEIRGT